MGLGDAGEWRAERRPVEKRGTSALRLGFGENSASLREFPYQAGANGSVDAAEYVKNRRRCGRKSSFSAVSPWPRPPRLSDIAMDARMLKALHGGGSASLARRRAKEPVRPDA